MSNELVIDVNPKEIVIAGELGSKETSQLIEAINQNFIPGKILLFRPTGNEEPEITKLSPFLINLNLVNGKPAVYICENQTCQQPETDPKKVVQALAK